MSPYGNFGIRRLLDANQRFTAPGLPFYLRVKNFIDNANIEELGFVFVPSITGGNLPTGTTDFQIRPQPEITLLSMHSLAMAVQAGVELRAGARVVTISHTWVEARQLLMGYTTPQQVFKDKSVVGIVTDNLLLNPESITHEDAYGTYFSWKLLCNASELSGA